ncbi:MAG TPA: papain-like cysteine protease family protein, partial [Puia sp.]
MTKRNLFLCLLTGMAIFNLTSCCTPNPTIGSQPVTLYPQKTSMWCWAASGEMCMNFLGANIQQCDEANKRFGRTDCCNAPVPTACVNGGWPEFDKYGFKADVTSDAPLSF